MMNTFRRARNLSRFRKIIAVLIRHGFGSFLVAIQANRYAPIPILPIRRSGARLDLSPAEHFRIALEELGPTFIKLGQILSTRPDLIPPDFVVELTKLLNQAPPTPWKDVLELLLKEYQQPLENIFASIDPVPLGSASLSQVHTATLHGGEQVVLKVQRPHIRQVIRADLEILQELARLAQTTTWGQLYNPVEIVAQFAFTLQNELDFRLEGLNADRFRNNFSLETHLKVPKIYWEYTTNRVLVMERLYGVRIDDVQGLEAAGFDPPEVAALAARIVVKEILGDGFFHADPHPGNFLIMPNSEAEENPDPGAVPADLAPDQPVATEQPAAKNQPASEHPERAGDGVGRGIPPAQTAAPADDTLQTPPVSVDERPLRPVIGAMDFGMVGHVSRLDRQNLIQLYILGDRKDTHGLVQHLRRIESLDTDQDAVALERDLDRLLTHYRDLPSKNVQVRRFIEEMMGLAFRYRLHLPADFWLLFKTLMMMDGLAVRLDPDFQLVKVIGPQVRELFAEMHLPWEWAPGLMAELQSLAFSLRDLPGIGENLLRTLQKGDLPLSIRMGASKETLDRLDRISTRFTLSILVAAFILGLGLILPLVSGNRFAMVLAGFGLFAAISLGIWLVVSIFRGAK